MSEKYNGWKHNFLEYILVLFIAGFLIYSIPDFLANTWIGNLCIEAIRLINKFVLDFPYIFLAMVLLFILLDNRQNFCLLKGVIRCLCQRKFYKYVDCSIISALFILLLKIKWGLFTIGLILYSIWSLFRFLGEKKNNFILPENENIDTDKPIESKDKDFLGRENFAEEISEKIRCITCNDSLVVGLYGEWGSGKTSFLNLMKNYLKEKNTLVFEFNPWFFTSTENLFICFLEFYYNEMKKNELVSHKRLIKYLKKYIYKIAKTQFKTENVVLSLENFLPWDLPSDSIKTLKKEIDEELVKLERRIVIVIDDIDRLNPLEIRQMVTLVKLIADFPKTTYILSFDDKVIAKILADEYKFEANDIGAKFLEKIVQIPIRLPIQDSCGLESEFISKLIKKVPQIEKNSVRFLAFQDYILPIVLNNTIRQVKRYLNSLEMGLSMINRQEINVYDYLYVEFLRIYFYPIYEFILKYKIILISIDAGSMFVSEKEGERTSDIVNAFRKSFENCCKHLDQFERDIIIKIMRELFTQFDDIFDKQTLHIGIKEQLMDEERNNRICSLVNFDKYFMYDVSSDDISVEDFNEFVIYVNKVRNVDIVKIHTLILNNRNNKRLLAKIDLYKTRFHPERVYDLAIILLRKEWAKTDYSNLSKVLVDLVHITTDKLALICDIVEKASTLSLAHFVLRQFKLKKLIDKKEDIDQITEIIFTRIETEIDEFGAEFITKYNDDDFTWFMNTLEEVKNRAYIEEIIRSWLTSYAIIEKFLLLFSEKEQFNRNSYLRLSEMFSTEEMVSLVNKFYSEERKVVKEFLDEHKMNQSLA